MRETTCPTCGARYVTGSKHVCTVKTTTPPATQTSSHLVPASAKDVKLNVSNDLLRLKNHPQAGGLMAAIRESWDLMADNVKRYAPNGTVQQKFYKEVEKTAPTLDRLYRMPPAEVYALINQGWKAIVIKVDPTLLLKQMSEPPDAKVKDSFPTSENEDRALAKYGIGFRCDTRDLATVMQQGFVPRYHRDPPIGVRHTMMATGDMFMWISNRDAIGDAVVCVSRTMAGCTKFPTPEHQGTCHVYALRPAGKGFDTEEWQMGFPEASVWRPGEKAMKVIPGSEVIAHVPVQKLGGGTDAVYYKYQFADSAAWDWCGASGEEQTYLNGELARLKGQPRSVAKTDDFLTDTKDANIVRAERKSAGEVGKVKIPNIRI